MKTVYPVAGHWIHDVPHVEQEVSDERAAHLVASGAFTDKAPRKAKHEPPPDGAPADTEPTEQVGSSDSKEA